MNEQLAEVFGRCFGLELVGLRYFNVYGPRQSPDGPYAAVIPRFFAACAVGEAPVIHGDGEQSRDFTYVADAVAANLAAAGAPAAACGAAYNVARGERTTVNQIAELVARLSGADVAPLHTDPRPGDVKHSLADMSRSATHLHFEAREPLEAGLQHSRAHYLASGPVVGQASRLPGGGG